AGRDAAPPVTLYLSAPPGDAPAVVESVRAMVEAGAEKVILEPRPDDDPVACVRFVAEQVAPLTAPCARRTGTTRPACRARTAAPRGGRFRGGRCRGGRRTRGRHARPTRTGTSSARH